MIKTNFEKLFSFISERKISVLFLFLVFSTMLLNEACKKKDECVGGSGGAVTIAAFPQHHDLPIVSHANYLDTAYVKFNTRDFPGTDASAYDLVIAGEEGEDHVHIPNLKCGDYFIYMTGLDTTINQRVTGGIPFSFSQTTGEIDTIVPVTE